MCRLRLASHAVLLALATAAVPCWGAVEAERDTRPPAPTGLGYASSAALAAILSRADVAAMRSVVRPNLLKGGFGEAHMNRHLLGSLKPMGEWSPLPARIGPQGLDGLLIRYDASGNPGGLVVSEAKYGAGRLKMTADGIQMGTRWRSVRLARMASEYRTIARAIESGGMGIAGPGGSAGRQRLQLPLPGGKAAVFARSRAGDPWEFVGPRTLMERAGRQADLVGGYLQRASEGSVPYESSVYRVVLKDGTMRVTIRDASSLGERLQESSLPIRKSIALPLNGARLARLREMGRVEVAKILRQNYPAMGSADVDLYSREIVRTTRDFEKLLSARPRTLAATIAWNSLKVGGAAAVLDVAIQAVGQYRESGSVDWRRVGLSGGVTLLGTAAGSAAGQGAVVFLTENPIAYQFMSRSSSILGLGSRSLATNALGGAFGGGVATVLLAYGGYFAGLHDLQTANRMMIASGTGFAAGAAFCGGMLAMATTFGTASTGTAIATLSGAAWTSATGAWLGGGSLAAGGFGAAGGTVVLSGGTALVVIGTGAAVYAVFRYRDREQDCQRIRLSLHDLSTRRDFPRGGAGAPRFQALTIGKE